MGFGYSKNEIMELLDGHLKDVNSSMEQQIAKLKKGSGTPEVSLATLLTSSMLSMLEAVSAVIDVNNKKLQKDMAKGSAKSTAKAKPAAKAKARVKAKPAAKAAAKPAAKAKAKPAAKAKAKPAAKAKAKK